MSEQSVPEFKKRIAEQNLTIISEIKSHTIRMDRRWQIIPADFSIYIACNCLLTNDIHQLVHICITHKREFAIKPSTIANQITFIII